MQYQATTTTGVFLPRQLLGAAVSAFLTWFACNGLDIGLGKSPLPPFFITALATGLSLAGFHLAAVATAIAFAWVYGDFIPFVALLLAIQWMATAWFFQIRRRLHPLRKNVDLLLDWQLRIQPPLLAIGTGLRVYLNHWATDPRHIPILQDWLTGVLQDSLGGLLGFSCWWTAGRVWREIKANRREAMAVIALCLTLVLMRSSGLLLGSWFQLPRLTVFIPLALWPALRLGPGMTTLAVMLSVFGQTVAQGQEQNSSSFFDPSLSIEILIGIWLFALTHLLLAFIWEERRLAQDALTQSELRYKALIEHSPEAIVVLDMATGKFVDANAQAEHFFRLPREKLLERGPAQLSPERQPDGRLSGEKAREMLGLAMQGQTPHFEWTHLDSEGREMPCDIRLLHLPDPDRQLVRGSIVDVSDLLASQRALKKSEADLARAQKIARLGSFTFDMQTGASQWSSEMHSLLEIPAGSKPMTREQFMACIVPEDLPAFRAAGDKARERYEPFSVEMRLALPSGRLRHMHMTIDFTRENQDSAPSQVIGTMHDITDRKLAELEVRALNQELELRVKERTAELETANRSLESFSYSVSHDLRAPLRALDGFSRALEDRLADLDGESRDYLNRIRRASQRMAGLIDDLLELARLSRREICKENVDLTAMAEDVLAQLRQGDLQRCVTCRIAPGLQAIADPGLARIVLENLLGNAWKFTSKQSEAKIDFLKDVWEGEPAFCVGDNGAGFDMAYAPKLFGPFQRLHAREEFDGNGIGLALVERVLRRHGGRIGARSEVGRGARFFFTLAS